jgi:hypothetical protein
MLRQACPEHSRRAQHEQFLSALAEFSPFALSLSKGAALAVKSSAESMPSYLPFVFDKNLLRWRLPDCFL